MSLAVAIPLGIASSVVYGSTIVIQHRASHNEGQEDARNLVRLLRDPVWVAAVLGDFIGFMFNAAALAAGPVVIIQPLVVLMLPIALIVGWLLGGPRPSAMDYLSSLAIVAGLSGFLIMIGTPGEGHAPKARYFALTALIVLAVGAVVALSARSRSAVVRGAVYGAVAGMFFGTLGVFVDGLSDVVSRRGYAGLVVPGGPDRRDVARELGHGPVHGGPHRRPAAARAHPPVGAASCRLRALPDGRDPRRDPARA